MTTQCLCRIAFRLVVVLALGGTAQAWAQDTAGSEARYDVAAVQQAESRAQACYDELDLRCTRIALEAGLAALGAELASPAAEPPERVVTRVRLLTWLGVTLASMDSLDGGAPQ